MIHIRVDNRARIEGLEDEDVKTRIKQAFEDDNPEFTAKRAIGIPVWGVQKTIRSWRTEIGGALSVPRGGVRHVRAALEAEGLPFRIKDRRHPGDPCTDFPKTREGITMRWYQEAAIQAALERQNCIIRAPTGSGKTSMAFALASRIGINCLVILPTGALLKQWQKRAMKELEIDDPDDIGLIQANRRRLRPLTLAMQRTLAARGIDQELRDFFGAVICDEVQLFGAKTFYEVIDPFPAKYRIGVSADERRKDRKEFLIHHQFGEVAHEVTRKELEQQGHVVDVEIRVVPTEFSAPWYGLSQSEDDDREVDFKRLLDEMTADEDRNDLILHHALEEARAGEQVILLTHRREHCQVLDQRFVVERVKSGFLVGGKDYEQEYEATRAGIDAGTVRVGVGTYLALGYGIDLPAVSVGVACTPIAGNRQNFNQVRGRLCRPSKGKKGGRLYYPWDWRVYPKHLSNICAWNESVKVLDNGRWINGREYLGMRKRKTRR